MYVIKYEEKLNIFKEKIEQYLVMDKLLGKSYKSHKREIYAYSNLNILCPSYHFELINSQDNVNLEISINPNNGEIILEFYIEGLKNIKKELYSYIVKLSRIKNNKINIKYDNNYIIAYIANKDSIIYNLLKLYFI